MSYFSLRANFAIKICLNKNKKKKKKCKELFLSIKYANFVALLLKSRR